MEKTRASEKPKAAWQSQALTNRNQELAFQKPSEKGKVSQTPIS